MKNLEKLDSKISAKLSLNWELCNYIYYSETTGKNRGFLYKTDETTFNKILKILTGKSENKITKGDKVYVLPGNKLPLKRIKEYLRSINATITNDLSKATVIAGNENLGEEVTETQALLSTIMFSTRKYYMLTKNSDSETEFQNSINDLIYNSKERIQIREDYKNNIPCYVSKRVNEEIGYDYNLERMGNAYFMSSIILESLFYTLSKKLKIVTEKYFIDNANSGLDLSEYRNFKSIYDMLSSSDRTNKELAKELLIHSKVDYDNVNTRYHLFKLSDFYWNIDNDHSKNTKAFLEISKLDRLRRQSTYTFMQECLEEEILTKEILNKEMDYFFEEASSNPNYYDDMFEFKKESNTKFSFELTEKWLKLFKDE